MKEKVSTAQDPLHEGTVLALPCDKLGDHPLRLEYYHQSHLAALTASIQANGLLEPIWVQPLEDGNYQIRQRSLPGAGRAQVKAQNDLGPSFPL